MLLRRRLHTSTARRDLFDFFKRRNIKEVVPAAPTEKTKDVMKKLEQEEPAEGESEFGKLKKLRVLGVPPRDDSWKNIKRKFDFQPWPIKTVKSDLTVEQIHEAIKKLAPEQETWETNKLTNVVQRFEFIKSLSQQLQVSIPDPIISTIETVADVEQYLTSKVAGRQFDERQPDAIYLDSKDFDGTNITIRDAVTERYNQKTAFKNALKQARVAERKRQDEMIQQAMR